MLAASMHRERSCPPLPAGHEQNGPKQQKGHGEEDDASFFASREARATVGDEALLEAFSGRPNAVAHVEFCTVAREEKQNVMRNGHKVRSCRTMHTKKRLL